MVVFWERGYEGATLEDLTQAMSISRPSLYAAFGNKEELFRKAMERYVERPGSPVAAAFTAPTAREAAERMLRAAAEMLTTPGKPRGCMAINSALVCGESAQGAEAQARAVRCNIEVMLHRRFQRAQNEGDLARDVDAAALARFIGAVNAGLSVQAVNGATRRDLMSIIDTAMRAWPS
ncbi:MAG: TetR/AcrR family transcriptional regulator [Phycisphaerales bacterium]